MLKSREAVLRTARELNFKPEIVEKVDRLLAALKQITSVPYLRRRLVLKGGTALNLFSFKEAPRLSVDIDLNYIGQLDRARMLEERQVIDDALSQIFYQNNFELYRNPSHHAGGKMIWRYQSVLGQSGNIEIDLNYMYRKPLWPCAYLKPQIGFYDDFTVPILDIHELTAGKLSALLTRCAGRDLFDAHYLLTKCDLNPKKMRLAFVVYLAMTSIEVSRLNTDTIEYDIFDIKNKLLPVLRQQKNLRNKSELKGWADNLLRTLKEKLKVLLSLSNKELEFIDRIRNDGVIRPNLITNNKQLQETISIYPAIKWAALKAKKAK